MDGPRFVSLARPSRPVVSRRRVLGGLAGGFAAALAGPRLWPSFAPASASASAIPAAGPPILPVGLANPASRIVLPGEGGLHDFGLDFVLTGPPAVFFAAGDTPGWSSDLKSAVSGFAFGYAATLAKPRRDRHAPDRAVQIYVHHGFASTDDAGAAWYSLTGALAGGRRSNVEEAKVHALDVAEVVALSGRRSILVTVEADQFDAVVLVSRAGADVVTVAIADFTGKTPTIDEAIAVAEVEAEKLERLTAIQRVDLASAFAAQWTPGFTFGSGAPFFAWPVVLRGAPVAVANDTADSVALRRQTAAGVQFQSHVEGPFIEAAPALAGHGLYYSGQSNFFASTSDAKTYHEETSARLRAGLPGISLRKPSSSRNERRYPYEVSSSFGKLRGLMLHRIVSDGDFPLSLALHVVAVPFGGDAPVIDLDAVRERLDVLLTPMRDGLENCLLAPDRAPALVVVPPPV